MKINNLCILISFLVLFGCGGSKSKEAPKQVETTTFSVISDKSISPLMEWIESQYEQYKPKISTGNIVKLESTVSSPLEASNNISAGKVKNDFWIVPSFEIINHTNSSIKNFGAKQVDCTELFKTPVVLAVNDNTKRLIAKESNTVALKDFINKNKLLLKTFSISHNISKLSTDSLAALVELFYASSGTSLKKFSKNPLDDESTIRNFTTFESFMSAYSQSTDVLLTKLVSLPTNQFHFVITTENEVINYNLNHGGKVINALYPEEGSYWLDYYICRSNGAWRKPEAEEVMKQFVDFIKAESTQNKIKQFGYRPVDIIELGEPFTEKNGVDASQPTVTLKDPSYKTMHDLYQLSANVKKPSDTILVVDSSASMQGEDLAVVKVLLTKLIEKSRSTNTFSLITFSSQVKVLAKFSNNKEVLKDKINQITPVSDGGLYEAIKDAFQLVSLSKNTDSRKKILIVTDSSDTSSNFSLLLNTIENTLNLQSIDVYFLVISRPGVDMESLEKIATSAGTKLTVTNSNDLYNKLEELLSNIS